MAKNRDMAELKRAFAAIPQQVKAAVRPAIEKGADEIVARAKYLAPTDEGNLAASIHKEPGPVPLSVTVTVDDPAALYQEYGTANQPQNRFFWPSVNTLKNRVRGRIDRAISKAVKSAWK